MTDKILDDIKNLEEMIKALDSMDYLISEYLSYNGKAYNIINETEKMLSSNISHIIEDFDESKFILALFERETSYWFADEIRCMAKDIDCPLCIVNAYETYQDYCFYTNEKQFPKRYETLSELKEKLFELYKHNRNVEDNKKDNIRILKLLTLINEHERNNKLFDFEIDKIEKKGN